MLSAGRTFGAATTLVNTTAYAPSGTGDTATGTSELAGEFNTGSGTYTSLSATLLLEQVSSGTATLSLYSDTSTLDSTDGYSPNALLATFTSPTSYTSSAFGSSTFTLSGVTLAANTNYWVVLSSTSGSYEWESTNDNTATQEYGTTPDGGTDWFADDTYPYLYSVAASTAAVPEPASIGALAAIAGVGLAARRRRRRRA